MQARPPSHAPYAYNPARRRRIDAIAMLIYIHLVYLWALGSAPMGRDYAAMAGPADHLPCLVSTIFAIEMRLFGAWAWPYHMVNLALLYAAMLLLYHFITLAVKGPSWLGVFAANLFMANPLHTESVMNLAGVADLLPCILALGALTAYASHVDKPEPVRFTLLVILGGLCAALYPSFALLPALYLLYEGLVTGSHRRSRWRLAAGGLLLVGAVVWHAGSWTLAETSFSERVVPLYFVFYCLGFLPETVWRMHTYPALGWAALTAVILSAVLIHLKARRAVFSFALIAIVLLRLGPAQAEVDWVHLVGGGNLLFHQALFMAGVAAIYLRIMEHPKWRPPLIYGSFTISVAFFIIQAVSLWQWRDAARYLETIQLEAREAAAEAGEPIAIVPDYRYGKGAPIMISESLSYDTPFGDALDHRAVLPIHWYPKGHTLKVEEWTPDRAIIVSRGPALYEIWPRTYWIRGEAPGAEIENIEALDDGVHTIRFIVTADADSRFPRRYHLCRSGDMP